MKIYLLIVIFFNIGLGHSSDCNMSEKLFERSMILKSRGQYLLSSTLLSQAIALDCNKSDKYRYSYGKNMLKLDEKMEALAEFNQILPQSKYFAPTQIQKKLFLGHEGDIDKNGTERVHAWNNKRNLSELKVLKLAHLSISQKEALNSYIKSTAKIQRKSPTVAASLSLIPGLGQAYLGAYQSAAISFAVNSLFLLAAKDFEGQRQYGAASASYLVFSITYLGNILNSHRTATNLNNDKLKPQDDELWAHLFKEL